jgi:transcriptional regulator with XRE-family HTH domain
VPDPDDERLARLAVAIRRRSRLTQAVLAHEAGVPRRTVIDIEAGRAGSIDLDRVRRVIAAAGGGARLAVWWHGAAADRLLDEQHAAIVERAVTVFDRRGWDCLPELSYSEFGERGSIDILAARPAERAIAVCEIKSELGSLEELNRTLDAKVRLAPRLATDRLGWAPLRVARLLVLPDRASLRRLLDRHRRTMDAIYPARSRAVRAWLRRPDRSIAGVWFLSIGRNSHTVDEPRRP